MLTVQQEGTCMLHWHEQPCQEGTAQSEKVADNTLIMQATQTNQAREADRVPCHTKGKKRKSLHLPSAYTGGFGYTCGVPVHAGQRP